MGKLTGKQLPERRYSCTFRQFADFAENCEESDSTPSEKGGSSYRSHLITTCESDIRMASHLGCFRRKTLELQGSLNDLVTIVQICASVPVVE